MLTKPPCTNESKLAKVVISGIIDPWPGGVTRIWCGRGGSRVGIHIGASCRRATCNNEGKRRKSDDSRSFSRKKLGRQLHVPGAEAAPAIDDRAGARDC